MNSYGRALRLSIFGESHGSGVGITLDGVPHGISLAPEDFKTDLERRAPGAKGTTARREADIPEFVSGVFNGFSTGAPITLLFKNGDARSGDYDALRNTPRPGHADLVLHQKFEGFNDARGGGHSSGRLTVALVAAGVIAKKIIPQIQIQATLVEAGGSSDVEAAIASAATAQDSIGGIVACRASNVPAGLGEPFFDSLESAISHLAFSIPAIKGIEFGSGFGAAKMQGSTHNDAIIDAQGTTATNNAGGINGGISNGNELFFRVAVKPTSSTPQQQESWNTVLKHTAPMTVKGRHDLCIALRVPVVVEAITAIALADFWLQRAGQKGFA